jgi:hypothetical protein
MTKISYKLHTKSKNYNMETIAVEGIVEQTKLSSNYFSKCNVDLLQKIIANDVEKKIGEKIGKQSENDLIIIMRSYFLQEADNTLVGDNKVKNEIRRLDLIVKEECVRRIITMLKQHKAYIKDINTIAMPIDHAESTNIKGRKLKEMYRFV